MFADEPGPGRAILRALGEIVSRHPSLAGGGVAFSVIFGFVAANALWHQPGQHPAPILKTREIAEPATPTARADQPARSTPGAALPLADGVPARTVTTFRIERSDETPTASIPVPVVDQGTPPAASAPRPAADPVLSRIQTILSAQGLYSGGIDGLMGPKSAAAIRAWEKANGYVETGEPTPALLKVMDTRPTIGDLIESAAKTPAPAAAAPARRSEPPVSLAGLKDVPAPAPRPRATPASATAGDTTPPMAVPAVDVPRPNELVRRIQAGLSNIAYADIAVDGVAGAETRAAIGAFEKHYRLPVTGEPNQTVLDKLIEIGAL
ncbi:hypothetical protein AWJ14_14780 [Hoeflea olei]|uniref:Peptidoglycan binding-like domain-containing protein n=1 Tax=Hoeflea olei TaxID=1480615 RepID=A0A1C1YQG6_9HYPH|nr:hypothetical protein AWJ14_14780 [Hoeflea olei]